jgi:hypothetical protein
MKKYFLLLFFAISFASHSQQWDWAKGVSFKYSNYFSAAALPKQNNLTPGIDGSFYLSSNFDTASCILKFNSQGMQVWRNYLSGSRVLINGIAATTDGIFLVGSFRDSLKVDKVTLTSAGLFDIFIVKFALNGNFVWAKRIGGPGEDNGNGICADINGNFYLTGKYSETVAFDTINLTCGCISHLFIAKYDPFGDLKRIKSAACIHNNSESTGTGIAADEFGNVYAIGNHNYFVLDTFQLSNGTGPYGASFLCKLDSSWNTQWVNEIERTVLTLNDIVVEPAGNILITGYTEWTNGGNTFTQKYTSGGQFLWEKSTGGEGCWGATATATAISTGSSGSYIVGGADWRGNNCMSAFHGMLIVKYDSTGHQLLYDTLRTRSIINDMIRDSNGDLIISGTIRDSVKMGANSLYAMKEQVFIAKMFSNGISAVPVITTNIFDGVTIYPNPSYGTFTITLPDVSSKPEIIISDENGTVVYFSIIYNTQNEINLSAQNKGVYFIKIISGHEENSITRKIIIE